MMPRSESRSANADSCSFLMSFSGVLMYWRRRAFLSTPTSTRRRSRGRPSTASCANSLLRRVSSACSTRCGKATRAIAHSTRFASRFPARRGSCAPNRCQRQRLVVRAGPDPAHRTALDDDRRGRVRVCAALACDLLKLGTLRQCYMYMCAYLCKDCGLHMCVYTARQLF